MKTISQVASLTGISTRTLQYYDEIDLLKPSELTPSGYRLYNDEALEKLQQILFYKELNFKLNEIKEILQKPEYDKIEAFKKQKKLLSLKRSRIDKLIALLEANHRILGSRIIGSGNGKRILQVHQRLLHFRDFFATVARTQGGIIRGVWIIGGAAVSSHRTGREQLAEGTAARYAVLLQAIPPLEGFHRRHSTAAVVPIQATGIVAQILQAGLHGLHVIPRIALAQGA